MPLPPPPSVPASSERGATLLRVLGILGLLGCIAVALAARWYYGRRAHLTPEWSPHLGAHGTDVSLEGARSVADAALTPLAPEHILMRLDGDAPGDYFGWSVAGVGDVNGDGTPDLAVGAHQLINAGERPNFDAPSGYVRVVSGSDGETLYTLKPEGSLHVDSSDDMFGIAVSGIGDLDGDGRPEVAVGSFLYDYEDEDESEVDENTGAVLLYSGASGERLALMGGERWGDRFGFCLAPMPDMDGDGIADLLIGVEKGETAEAVKNAGRVEVYSGANLKLLCASNGPGWEARMGHSCVVLGDLDRDGKADYASGAYMYGAREEDDPQRGAVGVFSGATGALLRGFEGAARYDNLGKSLANLGDVDGDGSDDLALGATQSGLEGEHTGSYFGPGYVRLHSGGDGHLLGVLRGAEEGDQFGWALANVGDRNGDGVDDLLVGAPASMTFLDEKLDRRGRVYLFSGKDRSLLRAIEGLSLNDQFGASIAPLGDLDGDGLDEVLIGAPCNVAQQREAGYAVVLSGAALRD